METVFLRNRSNYSKIIYDGLLYMDYMDVNSLENISSLRMADLLYSKAVIPRQLIRSVSFQPLSRSFIIIRKSVSKTQFLCVIHFTLQCLYFAFPAETFLHVPSTPIN